MAHAEGNTCHTPRGNIQPGRAEGQQHPIGIYLKIWAVLFVLSAASYLVDYFHFQGYLRWSLIVVFMLLKAGLIVAVFMHMLWERLALIYAIVVPPLLSAGAAGHRGARSRLHVPHARHVLRNAPAAPAAIPAAH